MSWHRYLRHDTRPVVQPRAGQPVQRGIVLIKPRFQLRLMAQIVAFSILGIVLSVAGVLGWAMLKSGHPLSTQFTFQTAPGGPAQTTTLLRILTPPLLASAVISIVVSLWAGLMISHRLAGPVYRFERVLVELRRGIWPARVSLRSRDEFHDVAEELTRTLRHLETRRRRGR